MKTTGPDRATREKVIERDHRLCRRCGQPGSQIHHRTPRGMGGTSDPRINLPSNLVFLCVACHVWVESFRSLALRDGWLVSRCDDPESVPVTNVMGYRACLLEDGDVLPLGWVL